MQATAPVHDLLQHWRSIGCMRPNPEQLQGSGMACAIARMGNTVTALIEGEGAARKCRGACHTSLGP